MLGVKVSPLFPQHGPAGGAFCCTFNDIRKYITRSTENQALDKNFGLVDWATLQ